MTVLSTEALDPSAQFRSFQQAICQIADLCAYRTGPSAYSARIRAGRLGFLECSFIDYDSVVIERSMANIDRDKGKDYLLALQVTGSGITRHLGREVKLDAGDFLIVDSTLPYSIQIDGPVRRIVVRFPRAEFARRGLKTDSVCGRLFSGHGGTSGLVSRIIRALEADSAGSADLEPDVGYSLASAILDLIAEARCEEDVHDRVRISQSQDQIIRRVRAIVLANLSDPDLSVLQVATMAGISVRYLHKLFGATGTTLHRWMEEERLDRCYQSLRSANQRHRTIQEIAFSNGFNDSGYFSHRFTRRYGRSPSQVRAAPN